MQSCKDQSFIFKLTKKQMMGNNDKKTVKQYTAQAKPLQRPQNSSRKLNYVSSYYITCANTKLIISPDSFSV